MNHTPGPWRIEPNIGFEPDIVKDNEAGTWPDCSVICTMNGPIDFSGNDARLIAAAPELLEALKEMLPIVHDAMNADDDDVIGKIAYRASAAIAKAEGR